MPSKAEACNGAKEVFHLLKIVALDGVLVFIYAFLKSTYSVTN
jgi:hypothetical protein